jgi:hypothetical protein
MHLKTPRNEKKPADPQQLDYLFFGIYRLPHFLWIDLKKSLIIHEENSK